MKSSISKRLRKFAWQGRLEWRDSLGRTWFFYRCQESVRLYLELLGHPVEYYHHI